MAYQVYTTDALVCGTKDSNTSDRAYLLFTRDAGMIWANAKSVREERSKHRYALQDFSVLRVSLVRGKAGWRITGTLPLGNMYFTTTTREARTLIRNMLRLLRRFIHGETPVPSVFSDLVGVPVDTNEKSDLLEIIFALRTLHTLGYIAPEASYEALLTAPDVATALHEATPERILASRQAILHAHTMSHL